MKKYTKCIENLRKYSMAMAAVLCCATATTALTSCGDDDPADSGSGSSSSDSKVAGVTALLGFEETEDVLKYFDVTVVYDDGTGEKTEKITGTNWEKTLKVSKLPAKITVTKKAELKAGIDVASITSLKYTTKYTKAYCKTNAAGTALTSLVYSNGGSTGTLKDSKIAEFINDKKLDKSMTFEFDAEGNYVSNSSTTTTTTSDTQVGWARRTHPIGGNSRSVKSNSSTTTTTSDTQVGWARRTHPIGEKSRSVKSNSSTTTTSDTQVGMVRK